MSRVSVILAVFLAVSQLLLGSLAYCSLVPHDCCCQIPEVEQDSCCSTEEERPAQTQTAACECSIDAPDGSAELPGAITASRDTTEASAYLVFHISTGMNIPADLVLDFIAVHDNGPPVSLSQLYMLDCSLLI